MSTDNLLIGPLWDPSTEASPVPRKALPTMYDLPSEDPEEPGLPDEFHIYQPQLLRDTFRRCVIAVASLAQPQRRRAVQRFV